MTRRSLFLLPAVCGGAGSNSAVRTKDRTAIFNRVRYYLDDPDAWAFTNSYLEGFYQDAKSAGYSGLPLILKTAALAGVSKGYRELSDDLGIAILWLRAHVEARSTRVSPGQKKLGLHLAEEALGKKLI